MTESPSWSDLPLEIWDQILWHVPVGTILELGTTLSLFDRFCESPSFWNARAQTKLQLTKDEVEFNLRYHGVISLEPHPIFCYVLIVYYFHENVKYFHSSHQGDPTKMLTLTARAASEMESFRRMMIQTIQQLPKPHSSKMKYYVLKTIFQGLESARVDYLSNVLFRGSNQAQVYLKVYQYLVTKHSTDSHNLYLIERLRDLLKLKSKSRRGLWKSFIHETVRFHFDGAKHHVIWGKLKSFWIEEYHLAEDGPN